MAEPLTGEDARQARLTKAAAEAMGQWFIERGILRKPVGALNYDELTGLATAAISGWLLADSRERGAPSNNEWLAVLLYSMFDGRFSRQWNNLPEDVKKEWLETADEFRFRAQDAVSDRHQPLENTSPSLI